MYSQNQGGDVRRAGAKIRYRLKFVVVQLSARDKIIIKKVSLLRVRLSGRLGDVCPGKGLHVHGRTYSSVSRCALVKTAASSASSLLWLRSLRKQREARLYMAAKTKTGRSDRGDVQLSKNKTKQKNWRGFMKTRILLHPKTRIKTWWWVTVQKAKPDPWKGSR